MSWFNRIFKSPPRSSGEGTFAPEDCLTRAGWAPGRSSDLGAAERALGQANFRLHEPARQFLGEYYGLRVDVPIAGADGLTGFVHFDPAMVLRFLGAEDAERLRALMPASACPVGTAGGHTFFLFLDADGRSYLLDMEWNLFAPLADTPAETVRVLCDGRNGRVDAVILDQDGKPTPGRVTAGDERRHWHCEEFPHTARFLPPVSLSPARRPPTWRPLLSTAEQILAKGAEPRRLLVTCGGLTHGRSGQFYFVAHCENSVYVRTRAGFQVSRPPPGVTTPFRVGECLPVTPPS